MIRKILIAVLGLGLISLVAYGATPVQKNNEVVLKDLWYSIKGKQLSLSGTALYDGTRQGLKGFNQSLAEKLGYIVEGLAERNPGIEQLVIRLDIQKDQQAVPYLSSTITGEKFERTRVRDEILSHGSFIPGDLVAKLLQLPEGKIEPQKDKSAEEPKTFSVMSSVTVKSNIKTSIIEFPMEPLIFTFSEPMNPLSVAENFSTEPTMEGDTEWRGNSLYFMPEKLRGHSHYQINFKKASKSLKGRTLIADYQFSFTTGTQYRYQRDILPIINRLCVSCHNINEPGPASAVHLFPYKEIMKYVSPGDAQSPLMQAFHPSEEAPYEHQVMLSWIVDDKAVE